MPTVPSEGRIQVASEEEPEDDDVCDFERHVVLGVESSNIEGGGGAKEISDHVVVLLYVMFLREGQRREGAGCFYRSRRLRKSDVGFFLSPVGLLRFTRRYRK